MIHNGHHIRGVARPVLFYAGAGLAALSLMAVITHAHQHHDHSHDHSHDADGHDPTSAAHATSRLWEPSNRGSLIAIDLDHSRFTALYYNTHTESIQSWSTPVCFVDRGTRSEVASTDSSRFQLCSALDVNSSKNSPRYADVFDGASGEPVTNPHNGIRTWTQPGVGQVYTDLLAAFESQSIFVNKSSNAAPDPSFFSIKLSSPVSRNDLKHAGVADIRTFWRLTPNPQHSRDLLTPTHVLTIYLGLILQHVSGLTLSESHLTLSLARIAGIIPIVPGAWPAYASSGPHDSSPLSALLRALPAFDSHPPSAFRSLVRPVASVHGAQVDQLTECLHRSLQVLVVHKGGASDTAHVVHVPLSDFVRVEPAPITLSKTMDVRTVKALVDTLGVTHVMLTGEGWPVHDVSALRASVGHADVMAIAASDDAHEQWQHVPYLSAAATVLDQQYSTCSCGKRDNMVARCDLITGAKLGTGNEMPQVIAASASPAAPLLLAPMTRTDYYTRHFSTGQWTYMGRQSNGSAMRVHERGWDVGTTSQGMCLQRADPRDLKMRKRISKHRVHLGVPPAWSQIVCLSPYHVPGRVKRLGENGVEAAVVEWWVVDKRWFAPDLGKEEGGGSGKAQGKGDKKR